MKIAVVFGAQSYEHEISIVSAIALKDVLKKDEFVYIFVDQHREFYHIPTNIIKSKLFSSGEYKKCDKLTLDRNGFNKKAFLGSKTLDFDVLLNLTHGGDGEDGVLAGMFDFFGIKYIGPRVEASTVSSNKFLTKAYAQSIDVKTIDYKYFDGTKKVSNVTYPAIIKPVRLGSSIGVSIVKNDSELDYAVDVAREFDGDLLVEPFINGIKEYNLAGTKVNGEFKFSIIEEPQKNEILDFDKKYLDFARTSTAKVADISQELETKIKQNFEKIYNTLFEGSLIRCDFFVVDDEVFLNEINSIPGSMANYLFTDFEEVFKALCNSLPSKKKIAINYEYVNKIQASKGK